MTFNLCPVFSVSAGGPDVQPVAQCDVGNEGVQRRVAEVREVPEGAV